MAREIIELEQDLKFYIDDIKDEIHQAVDESIEIGKNYVVEHSPERKAGTIYIIQNGQKVEAKANLQPGSYKKGWRVAKSKKGNNRAYGTAFNKTNSPLTWLLELGHKARDGSFVEPSPKGGHITPAQDIARAELDKRIKEILYK